MIVRRVGNFWGLTMDPMSTAVIASSAVKAAELWVSKAETAKEDQRNYQEKLEAAPSDNVFRYVFLINNAAVEQYVSQSRAQAEASFVLSRRAAIAGFTLLITSIIIGIVAELTDRSLDIAYLAGVGGAITEFIAGVFFWLYNRTLQQIHLFYQGIMSQQTEALAAIGRVSEAAREAEKGRLLARILQKEPDYLPEEPEGEKYQATTPESK